MNKLFTLEELEDFLKSINKKASPGPDKINNKHLVNLNQIGKYKLLNIINYSWKYNQILNEWKVAQITMIEKKESDNQNPINY